MPMLSTMTITNPQSATLFEGFIALGSGMCWLAGDVITNNLDKNDDRNYQHTGGRQLTADNKSIGGRCRLRATVPD